MIPVCLRNYYPYALMGFIDSVFFLLVQDKFSTLLVERFGIPDLSATLISGTISGSFSFFVGLFLHEKTMDKNNRDQWHYQWLALTAGNTIVCVLSFFVA
jgi:hypothetical protein